MIKKIGLSLGFFLLLSVEGNAFNSIDRFITSHCGDRCNGESDDCIACYNEAVDLFDQNTPTSPEVNWGFDNGKLEVDF